MGDIVSTIFEPMTAVIENLGSAMKVAFTTILYEDPSASQKVLSDPVKFGLVCFGIALATGLVMGAFRWIRARKG